MQNNLFTQNIAEIEISYKSKVPASQRPKVSSSLQTAELLRTIFDPGTIELKEDFYVLMLNRANYVIGMVHLSSGGMSGTVADPRMIFAVALKCAAVSIILSHNHPSGNNQPSAADIQLTKNICEAGRFLEIQVLDHIIMTPNDKFYSFADEGLI